MWKDSEAFHNSAKEGDVTCEARNPVRMRLEGWEGLDHVRLSQPGWNPWGVERGWEGETEAEASREVPSVIQTRDDKDMLHGTI